MIIKILRIIFYYVMIFIGAYLIGYHSGKILFKTVEKIFKYKEE